MSLWLCPHNGKLTGPMPCCSEAERVEIQPVPGSIVFGKIGDFAQPFNYTGPMTEPDNQGERVVTIDLKSLPGSSRIPDAEPCPGCIEKRAKLSRLRQSLREANVGLARRNAKLAAWEIAADAVGREAERTRTEAIGYKRQRDDAREALHARWTGQAIGWFTVAGFLAGLLVVRFV